MLTLGYLGFAKPDSAFVASVLGGAISAAGLSVGDRKDQPAKKPEGKDPKGQDPKGQDPRVNPAATVHSAYPAADVSSLHPIAGSSFTLFLLGH